MKQTRQAVLAIKQSIFLDVYDSHRLISLLTLARSTLVSMYL
jgi:hypothetical protein